MTMDTFEVSEMAAALPEGQNGQNGASAADAAPREPPQPVKGWNAAEAVNYSAIEGDGVPSYGGKAAIYEWNDEFGDVGPRHEQLENDLFGDPATREQGGMGLDYSRITEIAVLQEGPVKIDPIANFSSAGLHPIMLENVRLAGYEVPTPIQKYTIPSLLQGYDVIGVAQTGSGKTASYLIPILSKLMGKAKKLAAPRPNPATYRPGVDDVTAEPLVLVVVPTRELALQIFNEARKFAYRTMLRPAVVYGGMPVREQIPLLAMGCDILIGTPGRLIDFINRPNILTLRRLKYMVLDEADEMLHNDWQDEINQILSGGEQDLGNVKFGLFSATFPLEARAIAKEHLAATHVRFRVGRVGSTTENIRQVILEIDRNSKREKLIQLLQEMPGIRTIIFANGRQAVDDLDDFLYNTGLPVTSIHSERTQVEREYAMRAFRSGNAPILVATGVTARGIDVKNVMHVINYDLPSMDHGGIEEYTHRIGRTGRIGHRGLATSFFTDRDERIGSVLCRTLLETNQEIPDFLEMYAPEGDARNNLKFEVESDFDPNDVGDSGAGGDGGWGQDSSAAPAGGGGGEWGSPPAPMASDDAWGQNPAAAPAATGEAVSAW